MSSDNAFTEANKQAFDDLSSRYDEEAWRQNLTQHIKSGLEARKDWLGVRWAQPDDQQYGRDTRLLDYACGTGSITKAMGPWATHIRGIDVSPNMVEKFNETAQASGLKAEQVKAVVGDLLTDEVPAEFKGSEWWEFDVVVVGLGFHHFENPVRAVERLAERLKAGTGVLLIVDFLPFDKDGDGQPSGTQATIKHGGFARANMEKLFQHAKLESFSFSVMEEPVEMVGKDGTTSERTVFFARGRKAPSILSKMGSWIASLQKTGSEQFSIKPHRELGNKLNVMGGAISDQQKF